jgi:SagB-type dehydrogenase family enzyme
MFPADDGRSLSLLYHLNSEPWANTEAFEAVYESGYDEFQTESVALPPVVADSHLLKLLQARRSCRNFAAREMNLSDLSTVLYGAYGILSSKERVVRPAPSAGGLYPLELYVITRAVTGLSNGVHHYNVRDHELESIRSAPTPEELAQCFLSQTYLGPANALILMTAVFARTQDKYGPRGYRYVLLEAGHVAQNLCLLSIELGLAALCAGGFVDTKMNKMVELDGLERAAIYCVAIGHPGEAAGIPKKDPH